MSLSRTPLSTVGQYSIDLVAQNVNTYSIQILDLSDQEILADLPLDPMDNTLAAVIDKNAIAKLGTDAASVLETLSKILQEQIGAKEFVVMPTGANLPGYILPQNAEFKRLRQASRVELEKSSAIILEQYKELVAELDNEYEIIVGIKELEKRLPHNKPYEEIYALLNQHANFTPSKMNEYKEEEIEGAKARFNNGQVSTIAIVNKQHHRLSGLMRSLSMGNKFAYLSDEVVNQEILPLEKFQGSTNDEQAKSRSKFLLAYLTNKHCSLEANQDHILLIAPDGRVDIYENVGLQKFPLPSNDYVVTMKLGKPGLALTAIKEKLIKPSFSEVAAVSKLGVMPAPVTTTITNETAVIDQKQEQDKAVSKYFC